MDKKSNTEELTNLEKAAQKVGTEKSSEKKAINVKVSDYIEDLENYAKNSNNISVDLDKHLQMVIFKLNNDIFSFYGKNIREILVPDDIYHIPGVPDYINGIINHRGDIESVVDLKKVIIGEKTELSDRSKILLSSSGDYRCGLLVDELIEVTDIYETHIEESVESLKKGFKHLVVASFPYGEKHSFILEFQRILDSIVL